MTGLVTHFEIYGEDPSNLSRFYASLFGWEIDKAPGIDYWQIQTGPKRGGSFNGGLTYRPAEGPVSWLNYVTVPSVDAAIIQVQRMGGRIVRPKAAVPRSGWYAVLLDPQGNSFAIWQTDTTAMPPPEPD